MFRLSERRKNVFAECFETPEAYLTYFQETFAKVGVKYPRVALYLEDLVRQFKVFYSDNQMPFFLKLGHLLAIDAQLNMIVELVESDKDQKITTELDMDEEEIIEMIQQDKDYFYREITGEDWLEKPKNRLIYFSEKNTDYQKNS
jgi:hypothetical protein